jgi:hypothetical protein
MSGKHNVKSYRVRQILIAGVAAASLAGAAPAEAARAKGPASRSGMVGGKRPFLGDFRQPTKRTKTRGHHGFVGDFINPAFKKKK